MPDDGAGWTALLSATERYENIQAMYRRPSGEMSSL